MQLNLIVTLTGNVNRNFLVRNSNGFHSPSIAINGLIMQVGRVIFLLKQNKTMKFT